MLNSRFHTTVAHLADLPTDSVAEVAFAGRSNAGKSSAINVLANQRRLAFVSKMPGRTQHLNFFEAGPGRFLVDLPGYGFAKAPLAEQNNWQQLIGGYLVRRPQLAGLVLIMDIRHPLTPLDQQLLELFRPNGHPVHILLSKADKLTRNQGRVTLASVLRELKAAGVEATAQTFSSTKREGIEQAEAQIRAWLGLPLAPNGATLPTPSPETSP